MGLHLLLCINPKVSFANNPQRIILAKCKQPNMLTPLCECIVKNIIRLCSRNRLSKERVLVEALMCLLSIGLS